MNSAFLETFLAVAEHGSMAEAARRLGLTPAAVAQRIQALEADLGTPVLARHGRRVLPTDAGRAILPGARVILNEIRQLRVAARQDAEAGELRIGAISTALTGLMPAAMARLKARAPGVDLFILPGTSQELYALVTEDRLDAALLVKPPFALPKTLGWIELRREALVLICPEGWGDDPLALLRGKPFIRYDRNSWGGRQADRWMKAQGITPREGLELDQLEAIAVMVDGGLGVSVVPDWAQPWPEGLRLRRLPLPDAPVREIGFLAPRAAPTRGLAAALLRALQNR